MADVVIEKLNLGMLIGMFVFYLTTHFLIYYMLKRIQSDIAETKFPSSDMIKKEKILKNLFKWYPSIVIVIYIIILVL